MQSTTEADVPAAMREVYRRLQRWRSERKGRPRIPEALWAAPGELAREHGVNQVSRALHLEFSHLKRVTEAGAQNGGTHAKPSFIELIAPRASPGRECIVDLEGPASSNCASYASSVLLTPLASGHYGKRQSDAATSLSGL